MNKIFMTCATLCILLSCQSITSPVTDSQPGSFALTQLKGLQKVTIADRSGSNSINLGDLHSTSNYYFLLVNSGGRSISNIHLSTSDSCFSIFPEFIDSLSVGIGSQGIVPIIKVTALHGVGPQGMGSAPQLSPGLHEFQLNISGTTKRNNIDTAITLIANAKINVLVMGISVHVDNRKIDLANPDDRASNSTIDNYGFVCLNKYSLSMSESNVTIKNTGNVNIIIKSCLDQLKMFNFTDRTDSVSPNDSIQFLVGNTWLFVSVDGNNTVCDPNMLQIRDNGLAYFSLYRTEGNFPLLLSNRHTLDEQEVP